MFEASLAVSRPQPSRRNRKLLPVAVAAHGALIAGVVLASYWGVSDVPEPDAMIGVVFDAGGPPPPLGGGERTPARQPERRAQPRAAVTPPVVQPDPTDIPEIPAAAEAPVDDGGDSVVSLVGAGSGSPEGIPGGVDGAIGEGGDGAGQAPGGDDGPIVIRAGVTAPQLRHRVLPRYTESARIGRREGSVFLEAIIDKDGRVANVRVLRGLGFGLDEEAVAAVSQWTYRPAQLGERIIAVYLTVRVDFRLR